ncbi:synaptotagmin-like protein 2 isoform X2 [Nerophis ophidion]|uniref:synaptotagmin-like protein 2 isoform X2 n=1 Tax=Nerophis ophidion TaxID=159077 RepID=UPI002ADF4208|nr:synaptotagmin-like protein 2 isoform X2 [Nerophis ophidion]
MIDLSFLTEGEQKTILTVLERDAELKKAEEQRVQNLKKTLRGKSHLRYLTGEWFYETKLHRHQDRIHGSDIIRASMKHTSKPLYNLSDSFLCAKNNEEFLQPLPADRQWQPHRQIGHARFQSQNHLEMRHRKSSLQLLSKKRKNPFNCELFTPHTLASCHFEEATDEIKTLHNDPTKNSERDDYLTLSVPTLSSAPQQDNSLDLAFEEAHHSQVTDWPEENVLQPSIIKYVKSNGGIKPVANSVLPKPRQLLIRSAEENNAETQQDLVKTPQINPPVNTFRLQVETAQSIMETFIAVKEQDEILKMKDTATLQFTGEKLKDNIRTGDSGHHQNNVEEKPVEASWKINNSICKRISMEQHVNEDRTMTVLEVQHSPQNAQIYTIKRSKMEILVEKTAPNPVENVVSSSQIESGITVDLVTGQAFPIRPFKIQAPKAKEVRSSLTKTCHPRVLQRKFPSPNISSLEGSPLRTFAIDIDPQTEVDHNEQPKNPVPRQKKNVCRIQQTFQKDTKLTVENRLQIVKPVTEEANSRNERSQLIDLQSLARSAIPQDYQHYLGPHEKAHIPPFQSDEVPRESKIITVGYQEDKGDNPIHSGLRIIQSKDKTCNQQMSTTFKSLSLESLRGSGDECHLINFCNLKKSPRFMSSTKSLRDLYQKSREEKNNSNSREEINQSLNDVSSFSPSISSVKQNQIRSTWVQTSLSLPVLQQNEADRDSLLETSFDSRRNTGSSASNISFSSGMDSMPNVSDSTRSICTVDFSGVEVQGSIHYAVNYIQRLQEFHIFVVLCKDLAAADTNRHSADPYVKCYLLPDKIKLGKRKTKVKKHTLNPTFNEILKFKTKLELLKTQSLYVSVWHNNTFGRNTFLGEVDQDMSGWDLSNTKIHEYTLKSRVSGQTSITSFLSLPDSRGLMRVSLRFLLQVSHSKKTSLIETGEVQIWVKDCKNLSSKRGLTMDPFVKCTVLPDVSGKAQQKSRVVKRTANPMFNHTMTYDGLRPDDLREACVEITVWNHNRRNPHYIGGIRLGLGTGKSYGIDVAWMDSTMGEANLWKKMLESGGQWVEDILPLRMLVTTK